MNIYVIVEGKTEKPVYKCWVPLVNNNLTYVNNIFDIKNNSFSIISGQGYPGYYKTIEDGLTDVNTHGNIDRVVISIDSEDLSKQQKYHEVNSFIAGKSCLAPIIIVIQHFCIETWALGNRRITRRNPENSKLREYKGIHDVLVNDPELLPHLPSENLNRSKFAFKYLKLILNERYNITYTKKQPKPLLHPKYFEEVKGRLQATSHIRSFNDFLNAF